MRRSAIGRQAGFTLLEVLVATAILGSVFVAALSLLTQSLRNIQRMEPHQQALLHAREKMNEVLLREEMTAGVETGSWADGWRWHVRITPSADDPQGQPASYGLLHIRLEVWAEQSGEGKRYALETLQWARRVQHER